MTNTDPEVFALARERAGYEVNRDSEGVRLVDEQLRLRGWQVGEGGELEPFKPAKPVKERAVAKKAPERAVPKD